MGLFLVGRGRCLHTANTTGTHNLSCVHLQRRSSLRSAPVTSTAAMSALLGEDGRGFELARRLESCGVWRAWLGEAAYSSFAQFLASPSLWDSFLAADGSQSRSQIQLQLRARALLFDKASVSLFLSSPPPSSQTPAALNPNCARPRPSLPSPLFLSDLFIFVFPFFLWKWNWKINKMLQTEKCCLAFWGWVCLIGVWEDGAVVSDYLNFRLSNAALYSWWHCSLLFIMGKRCGGLWYSMQFFLHFFIFYFVMLNCLDPLVSFPSVLC